MRTYIHKHRYVACTVRHHREQGGSGGTRTLEFVRDERVYRLPFPMLLDGNGASKALDCKRVTDHSDPQQPALALKLARCHVQLILVSGSLLLDEVHQIRFRVNKFTCRTLTLVEMTCSDQVLVPSTPTVPMLLGHFGWKAIYTVCDEQGQRSHFSSSLA